MKKLETRTSFIEILDHEIALSRPKQGVEVNYEAARQGVALISDAMPGDFGLIIERAEDYSIIPTQVFEVLNETPKIKVIAIVVHNEISEKTAELNKMFFDRELQVFFSVGQAHEWVKSILKK